MLESSYEDVLKRAIAFGDDTDTTAAVAGGIAGIRAGKSEIPARWRESLRGRELVEPLLHALVGGRSGAPRPELAPANEDPPGKRLQPIAARRRSTSRVLRSSRRRSESARPIARGSATRTQSFLARVTAV